MPISFPEGGGEQQDYLVAETLTTNITWKREDPLPANVKIDIRYSTSLVYSGYRLRIESNSSGTPIDVNDVSDGNSIIDFYNTPSPNLIKSFYLVFKNFDSLQDGFYNTEIFFTLYGVPNSGGFLELINQSSVKIGLTIQSLKTIKTDKDTYNLVFNRQTNQLSGDLNILIQGNDSNTDLSFFNNLAIFRNVDLIQNNQFALEPSSPLGGNTVLPTEGMYEISCLIKKKLAGGSTVNAYSFLIHLFVLNQDLLVTPTSFSFSLLQAAAEVKTDKLKIINPYGKAFTIQAPYWLELSANSGSSNLEITISTLNSQTLPIGDLTGEIKVNFDNKSIIIPVSISVISFVYLSGLETYNFCLDNKKINFVRRNNTSRFVRSTLTVVFKNEDGTKTIQRPLIVPYYNERASFDLGSKIHQYFVRLKKSVLKEPKIPSRLDNKLWMYPAEVKILVEELDADYNVVYSEDIDSIYFYPGKKPAGFPLLTNNLHRQRVPGSKYIFTYIQGLINPSNIGIGTANVLEDGVITRLKIEDDEDKIIFPVKKSIEITPDKKLFYYSSLWPGPQVINIQFENQNLCPESFTFSGHIKINPDYTHIYDQNVLTSLKEKYDVSSVSTLVINTGFIIAKCIPTIKEIIESKLCFIEYEDKVLRGFSITQKLPEKDTSLELIQFDLEFIIVE